MPRWVTSLLLVLILVVASFTRFAHINRYSYFIDESWNDEISTGRGSLHVRLANDELHGAIPNPTSLNGAPPWWRTWTNMDHVTHPPLYLIVLRWWRNVFGDSPQASRPLSATLSVLAILLLFDVGQLLHGTTAALWACLIMALSGAQIELAQEVRPYVLLLLLSLGAMSALIRIERFGTAPRRTFALGGCVLGMALTHYFAAPAILSLGVYALLRLRGITRRNAMISLIAAMMIFALTWAPFFWQQRQPISVAAGEWLVDDPNGHLLRGLYRLGQIPMRLLIEPPRSTFPLGCVAGILLLIPFILVRRRPDMLIWCVWLCGTVFFIAALDASRSTLHLSFIRYTLIAGPAVYMTLAALVKPAAGTSGRWLAHVVPACVALACLAAIPEAYEQPKPDYRPLASYLDKNVGPADAIVFYAAEQDAWFSSFLYLNTVRYTRAHTWPFALMTHPPDAAMRAKLSQFQSVWLVSIPDEMTAQRLLPGAYIDGYQFFPFVCTCQRITPDGHPLPGSPPFPPDKSY